MSSTTIDQVKASLVGQEQHESASQQSRAAFERFAVESQDGERYMTVEGFVEAITESSGSKDFHKIAREQYAILFQAADRAGRGKVSLADWTVFTNLLAKPDAEYELAFRLFDTQGTGRVTWEQFVDVLQRNRGTDTIPFDWNSKWANLYVGKKGARHELSYTQFAQMLRGLQGERLRQAFLYYDKDSNGYIEPEEFAEIVQKTVGHKLSDHLLQNLPTLCNLGNTSKISYSTVRAFSNVIREMDMVDNIVRAAASRSADGRITQTDFFIQASRMTRYSLFTPMEVDILFHFAGLDNHTGRLSVEDFARIADPTWIEPFSSSFDIRNPLESAKDLVENPRSLLNDLLESAYHFGLGAVAGGFGASVVYPIDLVKTRMQNQRSAVVGQLMYKNSMDCFRKVVSNEGFRGLYSGLGPQLIGVAPEKAIKLTVNDLVRGKMRGEDGSIWLGYEIMAGGTAGGCQVIFTNPLEIVKIRLQVQGELAKNVAGVPKRSAAWIVKSLGLLGLYRGASACLLRDIPFSAIYFPTYAHLKKDYFGESPTKKLGVLQLLTAGAIAGMPAAYLTTPADVIKTRLQVEARKGDTNYRGIVHAFTTILREEGPRALFKGGPARIFRSSPQFGATLAAYEFLQTSFPLHRDPTSEALSLGGGGSKTSAEKAPLPYLRSRNALKIILDLDVNFGNYRGRALPSLVDMSRVNATGRSGGGGGGVGGVGSLLGLRRSQ